MKKNLTFFTLMFAFSVVFSQSLSGYDVMKLADEVETAETGSFTVVLTLTNKKGAVRVREVTSFAKDYGDVEKSVIIFNTPKDVSGVGYLSWEYNEDKDGNTKDADRWLYMPAMKKVRRISGAASGDNFMGTDFTYDDMGDRGLSKDEHVLIGEESVNGEDCWIVECTAKDKTEKISKRVVWISKSNYLLQKADLYDRQGMLQRQLTCSNIERIDGYWTTQQMLMKNVQTGSSTLYEMKNVKYNSEIDDSYFTVAALQKGRIK